MSRKDDEVKKHEEVSTVRRTEIRKSQSIAREVLSYGPSLLRVALRTDAWTRSAATGHASRVFLDPDLGMAMLDLGLARIGLGRSARDIIGAGWRLVGALRRLADLPISRDSHASAGGVDWITGRVNSLQIDEAPPLGGAGCLVSRADIGAMLEMGLSPEALVPVIGWMEHAHRTVHDEHLPLAGGSTHASVWNEVPSSPELCHPTDDGYGWLLDLIDRERLGSARVIELKPRGPCRGEKVDMLIEGSAGVVFPIALPGTQEGTEVLIAESQATITVTGERKRITFTPDTNTMPGVARFGTDVSVVVARRVGPPSVVTPSSLPWDGSVPAFRFTIRPTDALGVRRDRVELRADTLEFRRDWTYQLHVRVANRPTRVRISREIGGVSETVIDESPRPVDISRSGSAVFSFNGLSYGSDIEELLRFEAGNRCFVREHFIHALHLRRITTPTLVEASATAYLGLDDGLRQLRTDYMTRLLDDDLLVVTGAIEPGTDRSVVKVTLEAELTDDDNSTIWSEVTDLWTGNTRGRIVFEGGTTSVIRLPVGARRARISAFDEQNGLATSATWRVQVRPAPNFLICLAAGGFAGNPSTISTGGGSVSSSSSSSTVPSPSSSSSSTTGIGISTSGGLGSSELSGTGARRAGGVTFAIDAASPLTPVSGPVPGHIGAARNEFADRLLEIPDTGDYCSLNGSLNGEAWEPRRAPTHGIRIFAQRIYEAGIGQNFILKPKTLDETCPTIRPRPRNAAGTIVLGHYAHSETSAEFLFDRESTEVFSWQEEFDRHAATGHRHVILLGNSHGGAEFARLTRLRSQWDDNLQIDLFLSWDSTDEEGGVVSVGPVPRRVVNFFQQNLPNVWFQKGASIEEADREFDLNRCFDHNEISQCPSVHRVSLEEIRLTILALRRADRE